MRLFFNLYLRNELMQVQEKARVSADFDADGGAGAVEMWRRRERRRERRR